MCLRDIGVGHDMVRAILPLCEIDEENCDDGIRCLENYEYEWDDKIGDFRSHPRENWAIALSLA